MDIVKGYSNNKRIPLEIIMLINSFVNWWSTSLQALFLTGIKWIHVPLFLNNFKEFHSTKDSYQIVSVMIDNKYIVNCYLTPYIKEYYSASVVTEIYLRFKMDKLPELTKYSYAEIDCEYEITNQYGHNASDFKCCSLIYNDDETWKCPLNLRRFFDGNHEIKWKLYNFNIVKNDY